MILFPPAKINLGLRVSGKRTDGYHELESLMLQLPWCDILEIVPQEKFAFTCSGIEIPGDPDSNLCTRAYRLLQQQYKLPPVSIHLHKNIPMGAGLGGGSADGTYTLLILNRLFDLGLSADKLRSYALELGSDCPLFVENMPQLATGRGEILEPFPIKTDGLYIHLLNPGIHVSTKDAFDALELGQQPFSIREILQKPIPQWKDQLKNDFETTVFVKHPEIKDLKAKIYENGALYAAMSGSGSTLFGIYDQKPVPLFPESAKIMEKIVLL
ncbi:MAG: 4-(cytidine 5-diphospho)-2-C-methyl-D-erythritol kinase [Crocinitomicaceae bacterium]|jgi:4-diphosphocytidyl-2-C-methyl-D-erythritol kinase|nr:4-(cytidine 5-diphospho)-2-C-methyl-D-erythritol kinase [Crocinitomicaceae bacterium]